MSGEMTNYVEVLTLFVISINSLRVNGDRIVVRTDLDTYLPLRIMIHLSNICSAVQKCH